MNVSKLVAVLVSLRDDAARRAQASLERFKPGAVVAYAHTADRLTAVIEVLSGAPMRDVPLPGSKAYRETYEYVMTEMNDEYLLDAAPDLLAACKAFAYWYDRDSSEQRRDDAYHQAIAAIAKAERPT